MNSRRATVADAAGITSLETEIFGSDAWTWSSVLAELRGSDRIAFVATDQSDLLGYVSGMRTGDSVDLTRIAVRADRRRQGVARALLAAVDVEARAAGVAGMMLEVGAHNTSAIAFYTSEGFVQLDERPRYYRDGSAALVLERPGGFETRGSQAHPAPQPPVVGTSGG